MKYILKLLVHNSLYQWIAYSWYSFFVVQVSNNLGILLVGGHYVFVVDTVNWL